MGELSASWPADLKGQFRTRDGEYCYPLTVVGSALPQEWLPSAY